MHVRFGALGAALALLLACAPSATAAVLHAVPTGGAASGACTATPCTLTRAFAAAADSDDIRLAAGTYDLPATLTLAAPNAIVEPEPGAARPVLHDSNATSATALLVDADGVTLRGLRVEGTTTGTTDDLVAFAGTRYGGQVERMEVVQSGAAPALSGIGTTVRDSVVVNQSTTGDAGLLTGIVIGSTFIADAGSAVALEISTARFASYDTLVIRNTIMRGGSSGGRDLRLTDSDGFGPKTVAADVDYSSYRTGSVQQPFGGGLTQGAGNQTASAPLLVNLAGGLDVHQQPASPTVNTGSVADASTSTTDWEGDPRQIGGLPDIGADELTLAPQIASSAVGSITQSGATVSGDVTPNGVATTYKVEYGATASYGSSTASSPAGAGGDPVSVSVPITGLSSSSTYHARLVAQSSKGTVNGPDLIFTTAAPAAAPSVSGTAVGSITTGGATVSGNVNPNNVATTYKVEYGPTASYGSATTPVSAGSGGSAVAASVPLTGLQSTTTYHARLVAMSVGGTTNGPDLVFTTGDIAPTVSATAFSAVTPSTATISGDVNPNRVATTYRVEYGTTILYGSVTAWTPAGSGSSATTVNVGLSGLQSTTTYHARLVATSAGGTTNGPDLVFTTGDVAPSVSGTSAGSITTSGATVSGTVNPNRVATSYSVEYGLTASYGSQTTPASAGAGGGGVAASVPLSGLQSTTTYHARLVATNGAGTTNGPDLVFTTGDVAPSVSGTSAGSITTSGATVSGTVNPNRVATTYSVEYGLTASYGSATTPVSAGSGSSGVAASVPLTGLQSTTTYHARLVATSAGGTTNGPDLVFTTGDVAPSVTGTSAGSVTTTGATISGSVNPNRVATTYTVQYGTTVAYGSATTPVAAGSGSSGVAASVPLTGLQSTTTYHARLVATSAGGTTNGPDLVFTTGDIPPSVSGTSVGTVTTGGATVAGGVNPNRVATTYSVEYGTTTLYGSQTAPVSAGSGSSGVAASVPLSGLTSSTTYHARLVATSTAGTTNGPDLVFTTGDLPPTVSGTSAGSITTSGATVSGTVNPNRVATSYSVEYGLTTSYGSQTTPVSAGLGSSGVAASVPLTGLQSTTTYHARLVATSAGGTTNGPDLVFTTGDIPPSVSGTSVGTVTTGAATVSGSVNPNRVATTYSVEYGTTILYGSQTTPASAGAGGSGVAASVPLSGLQSTTTYHARLVATNGAGTTNGPDLVFTTGDIPPSVSGTSVGTITTSGATVSGSVNPNRVATSYSVEYGTTAAYGSATAPVSAGLGSSGVAASVPLTGLQSTTTYHARLVAVSAAGTTNGPDLVFTTADAPPSVANTAAGSITTSGATVTGDVTPNRVATTYKVEYGTTAAYGSQTTPVAAGSGSGAVAASVPVSGLQSTTTYHARLVATSAGGTTNGPDLVFTTGDIAPSVTGTSVGSITASGVTVSGSVNPNRVATTYKVEYGATAAYGSQTTAVSAGSGPSVVAASVPLTGLQSTTTYHARLVATSAGGTTNGPDLVFTTADLPPSVTGTSVGSVTTTGATVSGGVNPNRVVTTYKVEYGTTLAYGSATTAVSAGSGASSVAVSVPLTGLSLSTTYHARLVAVSAGGTTNGPDLTFTTGTPAPSVGGTSSGSLTTSGATISGSVTPNGVATTYSVEFGTTTGYGSATTPVSAGSGGAAVPVSVPLTGLQSSTTYHARLVATSAGGTTTGPDLVFTTADLPPSVAGTAAGSVTTGGATISGDVTPNRVATTYRVEYGTTVAYGSQTTGVSAGSGSAAVAASVPLTGLQSSATYHARLVATSAGGTTNGPDLTFTTGDLPPSVSGTSAGSITTSGAAISGDVNPNRLATTYRVEYGATAAYGSQTAPVSAGSGGGAVAVNIPLTGLTPATDYHARLVATSAGGTTNGPDLTFTTSSPAPSPPGVDGSAIAQITETGASATGDVTPNGVATTYRVEYGATTSYGSVTPWTPAGAGGGAVAVSVPITGLAAATPYHARLVAQSAGGTTNGPDLTFTTATPAKLPPAGGSAGGTPPAGTPTVGIVTAADTPSPGAAAPLDTLAPRLAASLRRHAIRRGARATLRVLVSEDATVVLRVMGRKARVMLTTGGVRVPAGRRVSLKLSTRVRHRSLRRGLYRVAVVARDAAGNTATRTVRLRLR